MQGERNIHNLNSLISVFRTASQSPRMAAQQNQLPFHTHNAAALHRSLPSIDSLRHSSHNIFDQEIYLKNTFVIVVVIDNMRMPIVATLYEEFRSFQRQLQQMFSLRRLPTMRVSFGSHEVACKTEVDTITLFPILRMLREGHENMGGNRVELLCDPGSNTESSQATTGLDDGSNGGGERDAGPRRGREPSLELGSSPVHRSGRAQSSNGREIPETPVRKH